ncbi:arsenic transporter [Mycobacterium sp. GA-2829]|nr:arsenic transporter [Mycobacterium sp. GA-2829]
MFLAVLMLAAVLAFALARPRGWPEAVAAVPAAGLLITTGVISLGEAAAEVARLAPVVGFLAAILVLAHLCDDAGLFHAAGVWMARSGAGDPHRLLGVVFVIATGTTAILSLDATVVLLTPVVLATCRTLYIPAAPHAYATAHLSNSASLLLPVSNLTNLLAFTAAGLSFTHFAALMLLPWLAAVAVEYGALRMLFARDLAVPPRSAAPVPDVEMPKFVLAVLALTLAGFAVCSMLDIAPAWAALVGAVVLAVRGLTRGRSTVRSIAAAVDVPFLTFVLCLGVVVEAVTTHGLESAMQSVLPDGDGFVALLGIAVVAAVLSNLVNNLPAVLVLLPLVEVAGPAAVLAVLIGVNVGPNLTYVGSLANLLWRNVVHRADVPTGVLRFSAVGLATVPLTLVAAVAGLWVGLRLIGV